MIRNDRTLVPQFSATHEYLTIDLLASPCMDRGTSIHATQHVAMTQEDDFSATMLNAIPPEMTPDNCPALVAQTASSVLSVHAPVRDKATIIAGPLATAITYKA